MIERRRIWTDALLADYIRDELGFPGARQGAMVEKETVDIATGEVSRERWYLLTSLGSRQCQPKELLRLFRNHWSVANSLHHVKDRSWDEDVHTLRRPGLSEIFATFVNTGLNALRLEGWFPARMTLPLRAKTCAQHSPSPGSTVELPVFAIVLPLLPADTGYGNILQPVRRCAKIRPPITLTQFDKDRILKH